MSVGRKLVTKHVTVTLVFWGAAWLRAEGLSRCPSSGYRARRFLNDAARPVPLLSGSGVGWMAFRPPQWRPRAWAAKQRGDAGRNGIRRHDKGRVQVNVALCDAAGRMTQQALDRQLRKIQIARDACKGMAQSVGRDFGQPSARAYAVEHPHEADKVSFAPVGRKQVAALLTCRDLRLDARDGCLADRSDLRAALGVRECNIARASIDPRTLKPEHLHPTKAGEKQQANRR